MTSKVAVVTGANKGIGLGIVRSLCKQFNGDVYLTARDEARGKAAVAQLEKENLTPKFHQLDITDHSSIESLRDFLKANYGGLDVLVNNAAIMYPKASEVPFPEQAEKTCHVNYFANLDACEVLFPLLRPHSRVCNLSSGAAKWGMDNVSQAIRDRFKSPDITIEELNDIMKSFVNAAQEDKVEENGFYKNAYAMSKVALSTMTAIQQREMNKNGADDILINSCTPGYVATDMTNYQGPLTIEEGVVTPVFVSLLPPNSQGSGGKFYRDSKISDEITFS